MNLEEKEISTSLTLNDLRILNNIIDLVASKGLIKASDYTLLGGIYDKIATVIKQVDGDTK